ncbi:MAG: hypothetical protein U5Q44_13100 [Dehalococcoidia bacterium]|nr:hypothetical protein [Dehalococcoidia bacterium]
MLSVEDLRHATSAFDPRAFSGIIPTAVDVADHALAPLNLAIETGLGLAFLSAGVDPSTGITVADPFTLASGSFTTPTGGQTDGRVTAIA